MHRVKDEPKCAIMGNGPSLNSHTAKFDAYGDSTPQKIPLGRWCPEKRIPLPESLLQPIHIFFVFLLSGFLVSWMWLVSSPPRLNDAQQRAQQGSGSAESAGRHSTTTRST